MANYGIQSRVAEEVGCDLVELNLSLNENSDLYDPEFAAAVGKLDSVVRQSAEDICFDRALSGKAGGDLRFLMQSRWPDEYGSTQRRLKKTANKTVIPVMSQEVFDEFRKTLRDG